MCLAVSIEMNKAETECVRCGAQSRTSAVGAVITLIGIFAASLSPWVWAQGTLRHLSALSLNETSHSQAHFAASGTMSEARRDSTSSLQRKKPPWLKLDIPAVAPPVAEEPSFLQVGPGQQGLWVHPVLPLYHDPIVQPLRRQAFLRSVSMPAETAHVPSPYYEPRRPVLQRQTSITQTIRRYHTALAASRFGAWGLVGRRQASIVHFGY